MSTDERRAVAILLALLLLSALARWIDRPRPLLEDVPALDLARLEQESRDARAGRDPQDNDAPARTRARTREAPDSTRKLDINTATAAQLDALPGIGAAVAQRIIEHRQQEPFRTVSDLQKVRGVGPALAARLAPFLLLSADPPAQPVAEPKSPAPNLPTPSGPIDLNRANADELQTLSGVGPVLAARIVARRDSIGSFRSWEAVDSVTGVGPALLARLKERAVLR